jgi:hypothetical protein
MARESKPVIRVGHGDKLHSHDFLAALDPKTASDQRKCPNDRRLLLDLQ